MSIRLSATALDGVVVVEPERFNDLAIDWGLAEPSSHDRDRQRISLQDCRDRPEDRRF